MILYVIALVAAILAVVAIIRGEGPLTATAVLIVALSVCILHGGLLR